MTITTNVTMPPTLRPTNMVEWVGLITSAIKELRGEDWFLDNSFTFKEVLTAINNDKNFHTTLVNLIGTKLNSATYTPADIIAKLKTVDGLGSGLDADLVRGYVPVNKAGDVMTGHLTLNADPVSSLHAATKQYVDEMLQGFSIKKSVRALADSNITLSGLQTIDGEVLVADDRVLVVNQATRSQNGIYIAKATAWVRSEDADGPENFKNGSAVFVLEGTSYADSGWVMTTDGPIVVGTTAIEFDKFSGAGQIIPTDGLYKQGNTMGLTNTGVSAGTYTKVTVDVKGRVISATTLSATDIPVLDWSKITTGKPTTLSGYGITDGVNISEVVTTAAANKILKLNASGDLPANIVGNATGNAGSATKLQTARTVSTSGAATGSVSFDGTSNVTIPLTLADSGVVAGTFTKVTVNAKGIITSATILSSTDIPVLDWSKITTGKPTTLSGYGITDGVNISEVVTTATANKILKLDGASKLPASITGNADGNAATATRLQTARTITLAGDVTGTVSFDGTGNVTITTAYKNSGVAAGTYTKVTTDVKGNIISGTTLSHTDIPVLDWAKITTGKPTTLGGYGITDSMSNDYYAGTSFNVVEQLVGYREPGAALTGSLKISLPHSWNGGMIRIEAEGYDYSTRSSYTLLLSGYLYVVGGAWVSTSAVVSGKSPFTSVRFAHDGTKACIILGTLSSVWSYPMINVSKVMVSNSTAINWKDGWSIDRIVTEDTITVSETPMINSGFTVSDARKLETARTISLTGDISGSVGFDGSGNVSINTTYKNSGVAAGTYTKVTVDIKGNITSATTLVAADIPSLDWSKITTGKPTTLAGYGIVDSANKIHDHAEFLRLDGSRNMTGNLTLSDDPTQPLHATTKRYVDGLIQGIKSRTTASVATTANITLSGAQTIDGVAIVSGTRVLVKNQTTNTQNGIYIAKDGAWTRAEEYDEAVEFNGAIFVFVERGASNADTGWILESDAPVTIGTSPINFVQFSRAGVTEGDGVTIVRSGNIISQKSGVVTTGTYTKFTVDTYGRVTAGSSLSASDIPNLDWTKITSGKPTTLSGYGITDATPSSHTNVVATANTIGHVKTGNGIAVVGDGTISADVDNASIVLIGTAPNQKIAHADTSTQPSVTNTNNVVIQSVGVDGYGHVTTITSKTMTAADVSAVPTTDVVTTATANKLLRLNATGELPANITGNAAGNSGTATKLQTARTISLFGDASGSVAFDGTGNVAINVVVVDDSHTHKTVKSEDHRDLFPDEILPSTMAPFFTRSNSLGLPMSYSTYQDLLVLNTYTDASGGFMNALAFDKTSSRISHLMAAQSDTVWGAHKVLAYTTDVAIAKSEAIAASTPIAHLSTIATPTVLGHIKTGDGLGVDGTGTAFIDAGDGVTLAGTSPNKKLQADVDGTTIVLTGSSPNKKIAHADTSSQASISNTGATVIQSITVDGMGHITVMSSKTLTVADIGAVPTSDVTTVATANKVLKLDGSAKLPASITGDANTVDGLHGTQFVRNDVANVGETKFAKPGTAFADPHPAVPYAVKASGGISTDKINIGGKINLEYNATENSLDIVFL